jgi:hypothetical protein
LRGLDNLKKVIYQLFICDGVNLLFKDRIVLGSLAGMISGLIKNIPALILFKLEFIKFTMIHIAASVMYKPEIVFTPLGFITGVVGDTVTSGMLGIVTVFVLTCTGFDYWWYKGIILLTAVWFLVSELSSIWESLILIRPMIRTFELPLYSYISFMAY